MRFLDQYDVVLLDMNGTFMFGYDRFGPEEDFYSTYRSLGGRTLDDHAVASIMRSTCDGLLAVYRDPAAVDDCPTLREAFPRFGGCPDAEVVVLEQVFAHHELGSVPPEHLRFLQRLAATHALGVVSNIFAPPASCDARLRECGLGEAFSSVVFSSAARNIKPSPVIFRRALAAFPRDARVFFVGDSLARDIRPARALGLRTAWIAPAGSGAPEADLVIRSLPELDAVPL